MNRDKEAIAACLRVNMFLRAKMVIFIMGYVSRIREGSFSYYLS